MLLALYFETGQIHETYGNYAQAQGLYFSTLIGLKKLASTATPLLYGGYNSNSGFVREFHCTALK